MTSSELREARSDGPSSTIAGSIGLLSDRFVLHEEARQDVLPAGPLGGQAVDQRVGLKTMSHTVRTSTASTTQ